MAGTITVAVMRRACSVSSTSATRNSRRLTRQPPNCIVTTTTASSPEIWVPGMTSNMRSSGP